MGHKKGYSKRKLEPEELSAFSRWKKAKSDTAPAFRLGLRLVKFCLAHAPGGILAHAQYSLGAAKIKVLSRDAHAVVTRVHKG